MSAPAYVVGTFVNTDTLTRSWNALPGPNGSFSLTLAPGEEAELELVQGFEDRYLKPTSASRAPAPAPTSPRPPTDSQLAAPAAPAASGATVPTPEAPTAPGPKE